MEAKAVSSSKPSKQRSARLRGSGDEQVVYTDKTLEFAKFTHHLSLLEKLLLYKEGRRMFPVTIKKTNGELLHIRSMYMYVRITTH